MKKLLGLLIVAGAALSLAAFRMNSAAPTTADDWSIEPLELGTLTEAVSATGTVQPKDLVTVGGDGSGRVSRVFVAEGQSVKANDPLLQFDDRSAQLQLQRASLAVELAQAEVQRAEAARESANLSLQKARDTTGQLNPQPRDTDQLELQRRIADAGLRGAQLKVKEAQTAQQLAEQAVEMTIVRTPINGIVLDKRVTAGQHSGPPLTASLFSIAPDLDRMQVIAMVADGDVAKLRVNQLARFTVNAYPEMTFEGKVARIANLPVTMQGAVQYPVTIDVANVRDPGARDGMLKPGMPAAVDFVARRHDNVWKLPAAAASVVLDESKLSEAAQRKLTRWKSRTDRGDWIRVWTFGKDKLPWPLYLRVGGRNAQNEFGISDGAFVEVHAWDPEETPPATGTLVRVITAAPESAKPKPGLKLF